jgi:chromosome segregation ATPase
MRAITAFIVMIRCSMLNAEADSGTNPIAKVVSMLSDLQQKIISQGEDAQKVYNEFAEMCEDSSRDLHNEIKTGKAAVKELESVIDKASADITVSEEQINDLAADISDAEEDLKKATSIRTKEAADFRTEQKELMATVSTIERSITILEREGAGASFAQSGVNSVTEALKAMVEAHAVSAADGESLMALVQTSSESEEDEDDVGAPDAAAFQSQSGPVTETLEGLLAKAEKQLAEARKAETDASDAYQMQKQSLEDKIKHGEKELAETKKDRAATEEKKATAMGDLDVTKKDLAEDVKVLDKLHHECLTEATGFEESTSARGEELKALAEAKKIVESTTGAAEKETYGPAQTSFLQVTTNNVLTYANAINIVRHLAMSQHSSSLLEFANHLETVSRSKSLDPFAKVKGLLKSMIDKLLEEADADATKKAYCDKEMAETQAAQDAKETEIEKITTQIDTMSSNSKKLKGQVAVLEKELGVLAKEQAEMNKLRLEQKSAYEKTKPELELGIKGVKLALKVLRDYYSKDDKDAEEGAATGIIGLLEVCESDFSKGLAELEAEEQAAVASYTESTNENEISKTKKEEDVKYKTKEHVSLDKNIAVLQSDLSGVQDELDAVNQYFVGIKKECVAKPDSYEERVKRREAEIAGLKDALTKIEEDAAFLQEGHTRRNLRGSTPLQASD